MTTAANPLRPPPAAFEPHARAQRPPAPDGQVETAELWPILWHRRAWIGGLATLLVGSALAYSLLTPWLYTATAQILIDPRDKVVMSNDINPSAIAPDGGVTQVESQARVIESSAVLGRAIRATDLAHDPEFAARSGVMARLTQLFDPQAATVPDEGKGAARALVALRKRLSIKRADKVFVIDVAVTARSPDKAAAIANAIAQAYLDDQAAARSTSARDASDALAGRLSEQKLHVDDTETAVERYKAEHGLLAAANGILVSDQQLTELAAQIETARSRTAEAQTRLDQIEAARRGGAHDDATAEALGSTVVSQLRARFAGLVERQAQLSQDLGPRHPALAAIEAQRRDIRLLIASELDRIVRAARADADRARGNEAALAQRLARLTTETLASKQALVRLRALERDLDASRTVYNAFLLRAQETREQSTIDSSNARIITPAAPPPDRSWPLIGYLVLGALGSGLGLGAAGAFAGEYMSPTILSRRQLQRALAVRVIAVAHASRRSAASSRPTAVDDAAFDLVLRRVVEAGSAAGGPDRLISVLLASGPGGSAGMAGLAWDLAAAAAAMGERVLLVDASGPTRGETPAPGLLDVLRGDLPLDLAVIREADSRLALLGPGTRRPGQSDRRPAQLVAGLFAQAARRFDIMIVDAGVAEHNPRLGPLLAGIDQVFVVAERGVTSQEGVVAAADALAGMGGAPSAAFLVEPSARV